MARLLNGNDPLLDVALQEGPFQRETDQAVSLPQVRGGYLVNERLPTGLSWVPKSPLPEPFPNALPHDGCSISAACATPVARRVALHLSRLQTTHRDQQEDRENGEEWNHGLAPVKMRK